jgi:hypothetical protein
MPGVPAGHVRAGAAGSGNVDVLGHQISRSLITILQRGIADGTIRADASDTDLIVAGAMLARSQLPRERLAGRRHSYGGDPAGRLRAWPDSEGPPRPEPLPPALSRAELDEAMTQSGD